MADTNAAKKVCAGMEGVALRQTCESTYAKCGKAEVGAVTCEDAASFCATNGTWPTTFATDKGSFESKDPGECLSLLNFFSEYDYSIEEIEASEPKSKTKPPAPPSTPPSKPEPSPKKKKGGAKPKAAGGEATHTTVESSGSPPADADQICSTAGNANVQSACMVMANACEANSTWPFVLETSGGTFEPNDQAECVELAAALSSIGLRLSGHEESENASAPGAAGASSAGSPGGKPWAQAHDDEKPPSATGTSMVKNFHDVNLGLHVTNGEPVTEERVLHFEGGKGIPLKLEYSVEQLSTGRYMMEYKIYKDDEPLGGPQSIIFSAEDGQINLGFQIDLMDKGNYGSVQSITIVEM